MGVTDEFDMDVPDLRLRAIEGRRNWNDRIDSFRVIAFNRRGRGFGFGRDEDRDNRPARDRICVYEDINYGGRSQCWNADEEERNLSGTRLERSHQLDSRLRPGAHRGVSRCGLSRSASAD